MSTHLPATERINPGDTGRFAQLEKPISIPELAQVSKRFSFRVAEPISDGAEA